MALEAVMERFKENSPLTVMARLLMQQALSWEWMEEVFEQNRDEQYTRELLFSDGGGFHGGGGAGLQEVVA